MKKITTVIILILTLTGCWKKSKKKVIVLGFDGITFDISEKWIRNNKLPNFKKVMDNGAHGRLQSTIPPVSPVAWTTAVTGVNPGKHSIFSFVRDITFEKGEIVPHMNLSTDRKAKAVWQLIEDNKRKSIIINIPHTSPPEEINGILISGEPHADSDHPVETSENFSFPPEVKERFPNYRIDPSCVDYDPSRPDRYLSDRIDIAKRRSSVMFKLMKEENWDLIWTVFTITDKIQHYYWKYMDSTHVQYNRTEAREYGKSIFKVYQMMDSIIGETLKRMDNNTTLLIMSDHGFAPLKKTVNTENFLKTYIPDSLRQFIIAHDYVSPVFKIKIHGYNNSELYSTTRNFLYRSLKNLKDPSGGNYINKEIYFSEQIYHGPWVNSGPDVVALPDTFYRYIGYKANAELGVLMELKDNEFNAYHESDGVLILYGNNIKNNIKIDNASLMDITPTLLYLFNNNIPEDIDGRVISESIQEEYRSNNPPVFSGHSVSYPRDIDTEKKLKSLDYL